MWLPSLAATGAIAAVAADVIVAVVVFVVGKLTHFA